jgi:phosphatidylglycerophosphate synthase
VVRLRLKARDAWWTCFVIDPVAGPLVRFAAARSWITPNRLTVASALVGLLAAACFALDLLVVGALVYQLSFLLDCMDGKLAAVRGLRNPWGGFYDVAADTVRFVACFAALASVLSPSGWEIAVIALYPSVRFAVFVLGEARPVVGSSSTVEVPARFGAVLRAAPRRLSAPGTTVDNEAVVFTLAPLLGVPMVGVAIGAAVDALHCVRIVVRGLRPEAAENVARAIRGQTP